MAPLAEVIEIRPVAGKPAIPHSPPGQKRRSLPPVTGTVVPREDKRPDIHPSLDRVFEERFGGGKSGERNLFKERYGKPLLGFYYQNHTAINDAYRFSGQAPGRFADNLLAGTHALAIYDQRYVQLSPSLNFGKLLQSLEQVRAQDIAMLVKVGELANSNQGNSSLFSLLSLITLNNLQNPAAKGIADKLAQENNFVNFLCGYQAVADKLGWPWALVKMILENREKERQANQERLAKDREEERELMKKMEKRRLEAKRYLLRLEQKRLDAERMITAMLARAQALIGDAQLNLALLAVDAKDSLYVEFVKTLIVLGIKHQEKILQSKRKEVAVPTDYASLAAAA